MRWTHEVVLAALTLPGSEVPGPHVYPSISTDTRTLEPGALFVAIAGDRFDGHAHLVQARERGALGAVVHEGTESVPGLVMYHVSDTVRALGRLAHARRREIPGPVIAITGTNGKTSTKEMMAAALATRYRTHRTAANENNLIGVPLTLLQAPEGTEAVVVEAGASVPGEIGRYRQIIQPEIAIVTNTVAGHLEGFGSLEGVLAEKLSLTDGVPLAVVGTEPPALAQGARERADRIVTAGLEAADLVPEACSLEPDGRARVRVDGVEFLLAVPGAHQAGNAMLVWAVARELGLDLAAVGVALGQFSLPGGRVEMVQHGRLSVLNDCYNANPQSFRAAIALAAALRADRRLVFVAGTMRELGDREAALHVEVAGELAALNPELLVAVGAFGPALAGHAAHFGSRLLVAPDAPTAGPMLAPLLRGDELVVLKASRGVALERILPAITLRALPLH
ncbi:MAG: UDP-N-acetylmuramoyl-tripeptide--D-alanyl-D-alanine ligase [Gemmatimonadota bacterium]|nr:UDP-N-acetylmuramoyl-tripeptide--D-alanyl-D-alanine ligase [Gemmatimonadota bacterium]